MRVLPNWARRALALAAVLGGFFVAGCAGTWFGSFDEDALDVRAYRAGMIYQYSTTPVKNYLLTPNYKPDLVELACVLEGPAYNAVLSLEQNGRAGDGNKLSLALNAASVALTNLGLEVLKDFSLGNPFGSLTDIALRSPLLAATGASTIAEMNLYRNKVIQAQLEIFESEGRGPNAVEWDALKSQIDQRHKTISGACPKGP